MGNGDVLVSGDVLHANSGVIGEVAPDIWGWKTNDELKIPKPFGGISKGGGEMRVDKVVEDLGRDEYDGTARPTPWATGGGSTLISGTTGGASGSGIGGGRVFKGGRAKNM